MGNWIKNENYEMLSEEEKRDPSIKTYEGFELILMSLEFFTMVCYVVISVSNIDTGDGFLGSVGKSVAIVLLIILSLLAVMVQKITFANVIKAWETKTIKDDILAIIAFVAITILIGLADWKGSEMALNAFRKYEKKEKSEKSDDNHVLASNRKSENSNRLKMAKEDSEKELKRCLPCDAIEAEYKLKIKPHKKSANPLWVKNDNAAIDRQNTKTNLEKDAKIKAAKAKIEDNNKKDIGVIEGLISDADSQVSKVSLSIQKHNEEEERKGKEREEQNRLIATGVTPISQPLLLIIRLLLIGIYRKMGYTFAESAGIFKLTGFLSAIIKPISIQFDEWAELIDIWGREKEVKSIKKTIDKRAERSAEYGEEFSFAFNAQRPLSRTELTVLAKGGNLQGMSEIKSDDEIKHFQEPENIEENIEEILENTDEIDGTLPNDNAFSEAMKEIIEILENLRPLYSETDFEKIEEIIEILNSLKDL